jgi:hypothetical protein
MKVSTIAEAARLLKEILDEQDITSIEMNDYVLKVTIPWDAFARFLGASDDPECYGRLDKKNNQLILSFKHTDGVVLVTKIQI